MNYLYKLDVNFSVLHIGTARKYLKLIVSERDPKLLAVTIYCIGIYIMISK